MLVLGRGLGEEGRGRERRGRRRKEGGRVAFCAVVFNMPMHKFIYNLCFNSPSTLKEKHRFQLGLMDDAAECFVSHAEIPSLGLSQPIWQCHSARGRNH